MPNIMSMFPGEHLKADDLAQPRNLTINGLSTKKFEEGSRPVLHFTETEQTLVLNQTNAQLIISILHTDNTDQWMGKQIQLYCDPHIPFGSKIVKGIRVRPASLQPQPGQQLTPGQQAAQDLGGGVVGGPGGEQQYVAPSYQQGAPQPPQAQTTEYRQEPPIGSDEVPF